MTQWQSIITGVTVSGEQVSAKERTVAKRNGAQSEKVVQLIIRGIEDGRFHSGARLIAADFADALGTSRGPVRDAFQQLAGRGVLESVPNRGFRIKAVTGKDLVDVMHMLKATGSLGIELAIENLSRSRNASQMAMLSSQLETTLEIGRNRESYRWFNALVQWHYLVNEVSENGYLNGLWDDFSLPLFNRGLSQVLPGAHWDQYVQNYENIGQAFWAMKGDECSRLFVDHINWAVHLIRQRIPLDQAV